MHFHRYLTVTLAGFTASALHVERKAIGLPATQARFLCGGKNISNMSKCPRISGNVGPRRSTYWRLVDQDSACEIFGSGEACAVKDLSTTVLAFITSLKIFIQNFIHKRTFTTTGDSSDGRHYSEWHFHIHIFYIKYFSTSDAERALSFPSFLGDFYFCFSSQVC